MKILRTYVLKEHVGPFLVILSGLTAVVLIGHIIKLAELVIAKGVSLFDVLRLLIYLIPYMLSFTIPIACLIAMIMTFSRLSSDYELIAMRASGVSPARLILPLLTVALVISGGMVILHDRVIPASHLAFRRQLKAIGVKHPTAYIEAGTFIKDFEPYILFVYQVDGAVLLNVRIYEPQPNGPTRTILAHRGQFEPLPGGNGVRLKLFDGTMDEWDAQRPGGLYKTSFVTYTLNLVSDAAQESRVGKKIKEMTFQELVKERRYLNAQGIDPLPITIEFHQKIASAFATFVFVLFGLALGLGLHHHERLIMFVWVLGVCMAYYLGALGANALALNNWLPPWLAAWVPNFIGILIGAARLAQTVQH